MPEQFTHRAICELRMRGQVVKDHFVSQVLCTNRRIQLSLRPLRLLYFDCGSRDQYQLHFGARLLARKLTQLGIPHEYEEFDDDHTNIAYRYNVSLPKLAHFALGGRHLRGARRFYLAHSHTLCLVLDGPQGTHRRLLRLS